VNAALELARQIENGEMPMPSRVVLPLGTGGTVAGMVLGFAIAGLPIVTVGARVGPRLFSNSRKVLSLASKTSRLITHLTGEPVPAVDSSKLRVVHHVYGGAYGRPLPRAGEAAKELHEATGIQLDETYSAKAWVAALDESRAAGGPVLFWLTFDASCLTS
jgi:D-cysteine desulfhydrase